MRLFAQAVFLATLFAWALPSDLSKDHWAFQAVQEVTARGWLQGYPDGRFRGEVALDRYQLATILARVLADSPLPVREAEVRFKDVVPNHWALPGIRRMVGEGLVEGFPDQTYRGSTPLTRYQLATVLDKLCARLGLAAPARALRPDDLPPGHWAEAAVLRVIALEILPLGSDGLFRGNEPVNRYQMARALWRLSQLFPARTALPSQPQPAPPAASGALPLQAPPSQPAPPPQTPTLQVASVENKNVSERTLLGQISAVPLPEGWAEATLEQSLVHLGQAQRHGRVWATLKHGDQRAIALLRLDENPGLEAFYPLGEAVAAASEGWAWVEGGRQLLFLDARSGRTRLYGPIGQSGAREALPPVFAAGVQEGVLGGVALDESRNYLALINGRPLCLPNCEAASSSRVLRLVLLGLNPDGLFAEYAYLLDDPKNRVVGLAWPKPRFLMVHEHDGRRSRIYSVDLNQADDLAFTEWDSPEAGLEQRPLVRPLPKKLLLEIELERPSGLALLGPGELVVAQGGLLRLRLQSPLW
ncbi:S-layer protein [Meiothermus sp. QL-1]|uniref:S-layer homology domain-containing protein n=1 Tax=Meiothermus sp. QL-1 TaxID=2058095 RepID=UPI000E0B60E7|nr:S-layer homology domain-containing protein [Meiothermus sp. QL-1]RDI94945.1 S-layer protein [Meiothermus sp. QL-1]